MIGRRQECHPRRAACKGRGDDRPDARGQLAASAEGDTSTSLLGSALGGLLGGARMADRSSMGDLLTRIFTDAVSAGAESQMRRLAAARLSGPVDLSLAPEFCYRLYD